jgi:hypothetical protein
MPHIKIKRGGQKVKTSPTLDVLVSILVFEDRQSGWMVFGDTNFISLQILGYCPDALKNESNLNNIKKLSRTSQKTLNVFISKTNPSIRKSWH